KECSSRGSKKSSSNHYSNRVDPVDYDVGQFHADSYISRNEAIVKIVTNASQPNDHGIFHCRCYFHTCSRLFFVPVFPKSYHRTIAYFVWNRWFAGRVWGGCMAPCLRLDSYRTNFTRDRCSRNSPDRHGIDRRFI